MIDFTSKRCSVCGPRPRYCFTRDRTRSDNLSPVCRDCRLERRHELARGAKKLRPWGRRSSQQGAA